MWEPLKLESIEEKRVPISLGLRKLGTAVPARLQEGFGITLTRFGMACERWEQKEKSQSWQSTSPSSLGCPRLGVPPQLPLCPPHRSSQHALTSRALISHFLLSFCQAHHVWLKEETSGEFIRVSCCLL